MKHIIDPLLSKEKRNQYIKDVALLQRAEFESGSSNFIDSCDEYLQRNNCLTPKQRDALQVLADGDPYDGTEHDYNYGDNW